MLPQKIRGWKKLSLFQIIPCDGVFGRGSWRLDWHFWSPNKGPTRPFGFLWITPTCHVTMAPRECSAEAELTYIIHCSQTPLTQDLLPNTSDKGCSRPRQNVSLNSKHHWEMPTGGLRYFHSIWWGSRDTSVDSLASRLAAVDGLWRNSFPLEAD